MTSSIRLALTLAISLAIVPAAFAAPPTKTGKTDKGNVLTDPKGMTLYTFAKDQKPGDVMGDGFLNGAWHLAMP